MEHKVVKCNRCGQYFMLTEQAKKCPFCKTEYVEVEEKTKPPHLYIGGGGKDKKG